jgi:aldehyde dehydrogenase (NAD+)
VVGEVGEGNRKDVRNAVEAARAAAGWASQTAHTRAQVLYYVGENLAARALELSGRLAQMTGDPAAARDEVEAAIERLFDCAAWADKHDGAVHHTPLRNVTLAMPEAIGTIGIVCPDERPLLAFGTLVGMAVAMGNAVVAVPSERHPLAATDFYQVLETSDVPAGVVNIVTGGRDELAKVLAEHADVDAVWYFGSAEGSALVERASVSNLKQTWVGHGRPLGLERADLPELLRHATQIKNIWVPYGA